MIYLNNAATTWPKPEIVYETVDDCFRNLNSPDRTSSAVGKRCTATMHDCRREVADFFHVRDPSRIVFTPSCTYASNLAILGLDWGPDDVALMSGLEHHAVSRPIRKVSRERGVSFKVIPYRQDAPLDFDFVRRELSTGRVKLIACTMASNVTGDIFPVEELGTLCREYETMLLIDAAQSAGVIPIDVEALHADFLTFAGHKGLLGPPGSGGLYVRDGICLNTLAEGGTGKDSGKHDMSGRFPSNFEVGTHNLMAVVGVAAGVRWLRQSGLASIRAHEQALTGRFLEGLDKLPQVEIFGTPDLESRTAVVSFRMGDLSPEQLADWLATEHNVATRAGYHCAPLAHETIGTLPGDGTLRVSFGFANTMDEVETVLSYLAEVPRVAAV